MSADNRTVATDALETLGTIIDEKAGRDAIHLAVEPAIAGETLTPGQHVGFLDGIAMPSHEPSVGIVDPFLKDVIEEGQRFWLVVYPRQIKSLRHVWTHDAFDGQKKDEIAELKETVASLKQKVEELQEYEPDSYCPAC